MMERLYFSYQIVIILHSTPLGLLSVDNEYPNMPSVAALQARA